MSKHLPENNPKEIAAQSPDTNIPPHSNITKQRQRRGNKITGRFYQGPIPSANELEKYNKILLGAADRILSMAEKEQKHRHTTQKQEFTITEQAISANVKFKKRGQTFAVCIVFAAIILAGFALFKEQPIIGISAFITALVLITSLIIKGRAHNTKPKRKK